MRELINKIPQLEKRCGICALVVLALLLLSFVLPLAPEAKIVFIIVLLFALIFSASFYRTWRKRRLNYEWLLRVADESILDSFVIDAKTYSTRPKVYVSTKALFDNQSYLILPYSEVVWVYKKLTRYQGGNVAQHAIFCARDDKSISLPCTDDQLQKLLAQYVVPQSPNVMIGYSEENQNKYKRMHKIL